MPNEPRMLVIGMGQIGEPICEILSEFYDVESFDTNRRHGVPEGLFNVLHICFPYSDTFESEVKKYQKKFLEKEGLTVIHSTVPLGACGRLGAVHSPVRGQHPRLEEGIRTFVKFFGGDR